MLTKKMKLKFEII